MEKLLCPRKAWGSEEDRNKLGTSRLLPDVLPETSPGDLQGERKDLASTKLPSRRKYHLRDKSIPTYKAHKKRERKKRKVLYIIILLTTEILWTVHDSESTSWLDSVADSMHQFATRTFHSHTWEETCWETILAIWGYHSARLSEFNQEQMFMY